MSSSPASPLTAVVLLLVLLMLPASLGPHKLILCRAILVGEATTSATSDQKQLATTSESKPSPTASAASAQQEAANASLDPNSTTFYYEADAFLLNKSKSSSPKPAELEDADRRQQIRARNGRMLDLDALVGDLDTSRANMERRQQLTSRQSRNLAHHMDIGGGRRLHIQGFIPIVGVKDEQPDLADDSGGGSASGAMVSQALRSPMFQAAQYSQQQPQQQRPKTMSLSELPFGQSSMGHASFNVQRYLNTEQADGSQLQALQAGDGAPKHGGIVDTLKRPIKKLTNTFGSLNNNDHQKQLQQPQQNCLCVPFYMCKSGYISESGLGRSQIQQMIVQQQQQQGGQLPRQPLAVESAPVASGQQQASYANSFVPVDERSFEREIVTAPPSGGLASTLPGQMMVMSSLESVAELNSTAPQQQEGPSRPVESGPLELQVNTEQEASPAAGANATSAGTQQAASPDEATALGQSTDYSQEILGRMLGLKANSRVSLLGSAGSTQAGASSQQAGGVCGLLRTCCNIPAHLFPFQPQEAQPKAQPQLSGQHLASGPQPFHRQQAVSQPQPQPLTQAQISRMQAPQYPASLQLAYEQPQVSLAANSFQGQNSLVHRTTSNLSPAATQQPKVVIAQPAGVQQFARAPVPGQQQSLPGVQLTMVARPGASLAQPAGQAARARPELLGQRRLLEGRCGLRQSAGINGRVQNLQYHENSADFGEYPAQAAILKRLNGSESLFVCSGTLISQFWVATAAHCIRRHLQQGELKVRLGEWDVHRDDEFYPNVEKEVRDLVVHPDFVPGNLINDLALLRLDSAVDSSLPHVNPACLPASDESFARQRCWVTGWGKDSFGGRGAFQSVLQEVELPVQGHQECESALRQTRLGPHYRLHPGFICAGGEGGKDACEGDGGSGLYCATPEGTLKVAGLVSWGIGCGQAGVPGVYVSMAQYRPWIENIIAIDEDIYSQYGQLPAGGLVSERQAAAAGPPPAGATLDRDPLDPSSGLNSTRPQGGAG